ncbi:MAG: sigma-70 family RNA polymerase sigma factor [Phycisphaerales bacterium]
MADAIFAEYGGFIRTIIRVQAGAKLDEEDLYQEFYLVLLRKPIPADVQNVEGYLYCAIVHHVVNTIRFQERYAQNVKKYAKETRISINTEGSEDAFTSEEQKQTAVARLTRYLPGREAQAFVLRYRDDCSILEIATRMGINRRTVSRYLSESLRRLHGRLAAE